MGSPRKTVVYSVKYNRRQKMWTVYVEGRPMVESENPGGIGGQYDYHTYAKKKAAVKKARKFAKKDKPSQLKIEDKSGRNNKVHNYG